MSNPLFDGLWQGYGDSNKTAPHAKNQPWFLYRNFKGPVAPLYQEPKRQPQVYNRWTNDVLTKNALRFCNRWLFGSKKMRAFMCVLTAYSIEKFWNWTLFSLVRYNNLEGTMEYAYRKEKEWKVHKAEEKAKRKALGLDDDDEEEFDE